ncbi:MAG: hypothetical protein ACJ75B_10560 [Flavisolibacter sp.]
MDHQAMERLLQTIEALGFDQSLEQILFKKASFCLPRFSLSMIQQREEGLLGFHLFFERSGSSAYSFPYYDAFLRKSMSIPDLEVSGVSARELEMRMEKIEWKIFFNDDKEKIAGLQGWDFFQTVETINSDLFSLGTTEQGKEAALLLKVRFWADLPGAEEYWNASLKSRYEIVQRFYLSPEGGITTEEAYRFLQNRWMEKQLQAKKKEEVLETALGKENKGGHTKKQLRKGFNKNKT